MSNKIKKEIPNANRAGRPKGALNHNTRAAKDAIAQAAEALGGAERMTAWAKEDPANERVFWGTIYPKLLPLQISGPNGDPLTLLLGQIEGSQLKPK